MKLFEFDITWDQAIVTAFDQDDVKTTGHVRVESDNVRVIATSKETASLAMTQVWTHRNMVVRAVREVPVHLWATFETKTLGSVTATRRVGPEELNALGKHAQAQGWM